MGYILNGVYHPDGATSSEEVGVQQTDAYKGWDHQQQREQHDWEIIQPHKNGKPNPDFIRVYPNESKRYFTNDELRNSGV